MRYRETGKVCGGRRKENRGRTRKKGKKATHLANECKTSRDIASVDFTQG